MNAEPPSTLLISGRISRKVSNELIMTFLDGPGDPLATAKQSGADGAGAKLGMLFGFKNGGRGKHTLTTRAGAHLVIESAVRDVTNITRDGRPFARVDRGDTSTVFDAAGTAIYRIVPDPDEVRAADAYRLRIHDASEVEVGRLDVVLRSGAWNLSFDNMLNLAVISMVDVDWFIDRTGASLPIPVLGTRLLLFETPPEDHLQALLGVCVDLAIGLRVYVAAMRGTYQAAKAEPATGAQPT